MHWWFLTLDALDDPAICFSRFEILLATSSAIALMFKLSYFATAKNVLLYEPKSSAFLIVSFACFSIRSEFIILKTFAVCKWFCKMQNDEFWWHSTLADIRFPFGKTMKPSWFFWHSLLWTYSTTLGHPHSNNGLCLSRRDSAGFVYQFFLRPLQPVCLGVQIVSGLRQVESLFFDYWWLGWNLCIHGYSRFCSLFQHLIKYLHSKWDRIWQFIIWKLGCNNSCSCNLGNMCVVSVVVF